jgi:hypothetical protein
MTVLSSWRSDSISSANLLCSRASISTALFADIILCITEHKDCVGDRELKTRFLSGFSREGYRPPQNFPRNLEVTPQLSSPGEDGDFLILFLNFCRIFFYWKEKID